MTIPGQSSLGGQWFDMRDDHTNLHITDFDGYQLVGGKGSTPMGSEVHKNTFHFRS